MLFNHYARLLWFWSRTSPSLNTSAWRGINLVAVSSKAPFRRDRPHVALANVGQWSPSRSRIAEEPLRGIVFPPGAAMDGAWRRGYDFAVVAGNAGDETQAGGDSPALHVLFKTGLAVSWFNFGKLIRRPAPQKA